MQSCKPENPSKHHTTALRLSGQEGEPCFPERQTEEWPNRTQGWRTHLTGGVHSNVWHKGFNRNVSKEKAEQQSWAVWAGRGAQPALLCSQSPCFPSSAAHGQLADCKLCPRNHSFYFKKLLTITVMEITLRTWTGGKPLQQGRAALGPETTVLTSPSRSIDSFIS